MGQEFNVLRCFSCQTFQVHQVKKSKKWSCKMCGEKQSFLKVYGQGSGADCRRHVQKLNALRGEVLQAEEELASSPRKEEVRERGEPTDEAVCGGDRLVEGVKTSRWSIYLKSEVDEVVQEEPEEEENVYTDRKDFASFRNACKTNSRKHQRQCGSPVGESPHFNPRAIHHPWKRAKQQKSELDHDLQCSPRISGKVLPEGSATNMRLPTAEASTSSRQPFVAEPPLPALASASAALTMTSKWTRFLTPPCDSEEIGDAQEDTCSVGTGATATEGNSWAVSAQAAVGCDLSHVPGSDRGSLAPSDLAAISAPRTGSSRPGLLQSLFQIEDDFDDTF